MTLPLSLEALERIAREATPGPWSIAGHGGHAVYAPRGGKVTFASAADRAHIATFDPPTVLSLLARIRALEDGVSKIAEGKVGPEMTGHYRAHREAVRIARELMKSRAPLKGAEHG